MDELNTWRCQCGMVYAFEPGQGTCPECGSASAEHLHPGPVDDDDLVELRQELAREVKEMQIRLCTLDLRGPKKDMLELVTEHERVSAEYEAAGRPELPDFENP